MSDEKLKKPEGVGSSKGPGADANDPMQGRGPVTWYNFAISAGVLGAVIGTYMYVKSLKVGEMEKERKKEIGKAKIGGPFNLIDHHGNPKSSKDFLGKWMLLYFGFTHCPDVCPDEMEKLSLVYEELKGAKVHEKYIGDVVPLFITVDPERDSVI